MRNGLPLKKHNNASKKIGEKNNGYITANKSGGEEDACNLVILTELGEGWIT